MPDHTDELEGGRTGWVAELCASLVAGSLVEAGNTVADQEGEHRSEEAVGRTEASLAVADSQ